MSQFQKGQSGNPGGRPRGSKNRFTELKQDLLAAYEHATKKEKGGIEFWRTIKRTHPIVFARILAGLLPKDLRGELGEPVNVIVKYTQVSDAEIKKRQEQRGKKQPAG